MEIRGLNPYVLVSAQKAALLKPNWRRPMPVRVQINGEPDPPWRINMMPVGDGSFYLYLHGDVRELSGTKAGDVVNVEISFDHEYRGGPADPMPSWFEDALRLNRAAQLGWERLPPSRQKEIVRYLVRLKSLEAQQRNTKQALHVLAGGKARFMARDWNS
jgi:hypothetical protein